MPAKSYAQKAVRIATGREVEDILRELYVDQGRSQEEIAAALGVSRGAIVAWLREYGIEKRPPLDPLVAA